MRICFTGHRPDKLGGYDWSTDKNKEIIRAIGHYLISEVLEDGEAFHFICGGAIGIDQMAFSICATLQKLFRDVSTEIAVPFKTQDCKWNQEDVKRYQGQLTRAGRVTYVDRLKRYQVPGYKEDVYYSLKMQKRNEYMVNNADLVIAVWNGSRGGTGNCVAYAEEQGKKIVVINPVTLKVSEW